MLMQESDILAPVLSLSLYVMVPVPLHRFLQEHIFGNNLNRVSHIQRLKPSQNYGLDGF